MDEVIDELDLEAGAATAWMTLSLRRWDVPAENGRQL
jgi:hypothetical protein